MFMRNNTRYILLVVAFLSLTASTNYTALRKHNTQNNQTEKVWVDSIYSMMSVEERLGQLFAIRAHSDKGPEHVAAVEQIITKYHVGGLCFFQGTPEEQVKLTNRYQQLNKRVPLMISIDGEWGLGMRMKNTTISFPRQLTLGAIQDNNLIYNMGKEIAYQMRRIGIHLNFAPVADVNNNAANPVIHTRSFGEDRYNVAAKSYMYMKGMEDHGLMACAKHFPGHGDTNVDSHLDLPIINHSKSRLDSIELYPFRVLAEQNIGSFMVGHLSVPALDKRPNRPTSLSYPTITELLRKEIGYNGLIFTDALEMKGVTKYFTDGLTEAEALRAGNDILLLPENIEASIRQIKNYIQEGYIPEAQLEASVKRILSAKYRLGLTKFVPIDEKNIAQDLNAPRGLAVKQTLYENAITLVRNQNDLLPFRDLETLKIASLSLGTERKTPFQDRLSAYSTMSQLQTDKNVTEADARQLMQKLGDSEIIVVSFHDLTSSESKGYGITESELNFVKQLANSKKKVIIVNFGTPYALKYFDDFEWVIQANDEDYIAQDVAAQAIFGAIPMKGRLPVTASPRSRYNTGIVTNELFRLGYAYPESVGLVSDTLRQIDSLIALAIKEKATPGAVVLVARNGKIIYEKAFGTHTYGDIQATQVSDIFDVASITKIAASTISIMKLHEEGKISIHQPIGNYLPQTVGTNKANLTLYDVMAHRAGLKAWIPFYQQTIKEVPRGEGLASAYYSRREVDNFAVKITDQLYLRKDFQDSIWQQIYQSPVTPQQGYIYSDLGFYLAGKIVEKSTSLRVDKYAYKTFYAPLGLQSTTYNPLEKFDKLRIVPTEEDRYWRNQKLQGYVHDMGAAMLDGVSGHAGLFSNAKDLAVLMQMLLNMGYYGGKQYLNPATIRTFTTRHANDTRRGIGFDMLDVSPDKEPNISNKASKTTFGHYGFTGTGVWADPEHNLIFVFLSNRTYPSMDNNKLGSNNYRPRIQTIIYNALEKEDIKEVNIK